MMPVKAVVDTNVLQKANAAIENQPRSGRKFLKRLELLKAIHGGTIKILVSRKLLNEYRQQIREPRNLYVQNFFALLTQPDGVVLNWTSWSGQVREKASRCRFPNEDRHLLRTAICPNERTQIISEEIRLLRTDTCIYREFSIHVIDPTA
jgi:predicted nucleic acid-binding protein